MSKKIIQFPGICTGKTKTGRGVKRYIHGIGVMARGKILIVEHAEHLEDISKAKIYNIHEVIPDSLLVVSEE